MLQPLLYPRRLICCHVLLKICTRSVSHCFRFPIGTPSRLAYSACVMFLAARMALICATIHSHVFCHICAEEPLG